GVPPGCGRRWRCGQSAAVRVRRRRRGRRVHRRYDPARALSGHDDPPPRPLRSDGRGPGAVHRSVLLRRGSEPRRQRAPRGRGTRDAGRRVRTRRRDALGRAARDPRAGTVRPVRAHAARVAPDRSGRSRAQGLLAECRLGALQRRCRSAGLRAAGTRCRVESRGPRTGRRAMLARPAATHSQPKESPMKKTLLVSFVLATTPLGIAQDTAEAPAMPSPKVEEHEALKSLAGTWDSTVRMAAMPGVPGMEEATEVEGTERAELICDGLWLKWTVEGEFAGQPFQGLWLAGYDPFAERYVGFWIDSNEPTPMEMTGEYDASSKKWAWSGECSQGAMRSEITWKDADTMVETSWLTPPG